MSNGDSVIKFHRSIANGERSPWHDVPNERIANELTKPSPLLALAIPNNRDNTLSRQFSDTITLSSESEQELLGFGESTGQVLDFLLLKAQASRNFEGLVFTVGDFMKARGLKDRKTAREQLYAAFRNLFHVSVTYDTTAIRKKPKRKRTEAEELYLNLGKFRIIDNFPEIDNKGNIPLSFSKLYAPVLRAVTPMPYHETLLTINPNNNRYSYKMGRKIFEHKYMTIRFRDRDSDGTGYDRENVLKVTTLLEAAGLPTHTELQAAQEKESDPKKRNALFLRAKKYRQKVIEPFERDLDALSDAFAWEYLLDGKPLPEGFAITSQNFHTLSVLFHFINYPQQEERLARIDEQRQSDYQKRVAFIKRSEAKKESIPVGDGVEVVP